MLSCGRNVLHINGESIDYMYCLLIWLHMVFQFEYTGGTQHHMCVGSMPGLNNGHWCVLQIRLSWLLQWRTV